MNKPCCGKTLQTFCPDFEEWPRRWSACERDLPAGNALLDDMAPFIEHLIARGRADRTIKRHCTHLWLLGGKIIRVVNMNGAFRRDPHKQLMETIGPDGGPLCQHLRSGADQEAFDATCRKLHRFLCIYRRDQSRGLPLKENISKPSEPPPSQHAKPVSLPGRSVRAIAEADWKHFKRVYPAALERHYERILREVARAAASPGVPAQKRYLDVWEALKEHDMDLRLAFDGVRRPTVPAGLAAMRHQELLTEVEFAGFSEELRGRVAQILSCWEKK